MPEAMPSRWVFAARYPSWLTASKLYASGTKTIYLFLKDCIDLILRTNSRALFLLIAGAHNEETVAIIRSLFSAQLRHSANKMKVAKLGQMS